jgi:hypothetical protein
MFMPSPRWPKGTSGNPGGRPALDPALKAKLAALTPKAIDRLARALDGDDDRVAVTAAMALLDRALGRPATFADLTVRKEGSTTDTHLSALLEVARRRRQEPICLDDSSPPWTSQDAYRPAGTDGSVPLIEDRSSSSRDK